MNQSPRDLQIETSCVSTTLPFGFRHRPVTSPRILIIFLHGYSDHGGSFVRRLFPDQWPTSFEHVAALAPNGPFPTPVKTESGWREAYAWYFYDEKEARMMITPETAVTACEKLVQDFGYEDVPKILVGFSQGGYLAPNLAKRLKNVREIIAVATGFREDYYPQNAKWRVNAVHGSNDEIFPVAKAREAHAAILRLGFDGEFFELPGGTHVASPEMGHLIETRVKSWL